MNLLHELSASPSVVDDYMRQLRSIDIQQDRSRFRENIRKIGRVAAYEISKTLQFGQTVVQTPLASHAQRQLEDKLVVITVLRAGLPLHEGILDVFPEAENGFVSAYRCHHDDGSFHIEVGYVACPDLHDKVLIINDPMLATGQSFLNVLAALEKYGRPKGIHLVAVIASREGVDYLSPKIPFGTHIWVAAIDPGLNAHKYIVPGLGDAGDLAFGPKLQS